MFIRTQTRTMLLNIDKFYTVGNEIQYYSEPNKNFYPLGTYATRERALEVLDEIQTFKRHNKFIEVCMPIENYSKSQLFEEYTDTYEMPKE